MQTESSGEAELSSFVKQECQKLGLSYVSQVPEEPLTKEEILQVKCTSFPGELKFSVPVELAASKKAFLNFVAGLTEGGPSFEGLWRPKALELGAADYHSHCPMGGEDLSFLKDSEAHEAKEEEKC